MIKCDLSNQIEEPETFDETVELEILETEEKLEYKFDEFETSNEYCVIDDYELEESSDPSL